MTRYLLATWEGGGVLPPELGLARRLMARGHQVHVIADPAAEAATRAAGCEFSPWMTAPKKHSLAPEEDVIRDWEYKNIFKLFEHMLDVFLCGPADKFARDTLDVLDRFPADVVLCDFTILGGMLAAESRNLPYATLLPNIYPRPAEGVPAFGPGFLPARGPLGRMRDALFTKLGNRLWKKGVPALNRARAGLGLDALGDVFQLWDRAARVLVMTSPSFDFVSPKLPANVKYVGPLLDDPAWATGSWTPPWPASNTDPIVLVGLSSTYQHQQDALRRVVGALAELPVRALVTKGPALADEALASPSPNVVIVPTAPHSKVLEHATLAITHCGHGTTMRALAAGVPLVCMPMGRDQNDTAARVVAREAGVRIKPSASPAAIRRAVETVLRDQRHARGAKALRDAIARETREIDAAAIVEDITAPAPGASARASA